MLEDIREEDNSRKAHKIQPSIHLFENGRVFCMYARDFYCYKYEDRYSMELDDIRRLEAAKKAYDNLPEKIKQQYEPNLR